MSDYYGMDADFENEQKPLTESKPLTAKMAAVDELIDDLMLCKNPIVKGKKAETVLLQVAEVLRGIVKEVEK